MNVDTRPPELVLSDTALRLFFVVGAALLLAVAFFLYWPVLGDFFALDDFVWLHAASNPNVADLFRDAFSFPHAAPFAQPTPFWRPAIDAYFFATWRLFETDATPYHVLSVALHAANATLAALLVWQIRRQPLTAFVAGLLFVVLPTYDIAVSWVASVTELLAVLFYLLSMVLYATYLGRERARGWAYWGALAALLLALLAKESTISLPVALLGVALVVQPPRDSVALGEHALAVRAVELVPFATLTGAYIIFHYFQQYGGASDVELYRFGSHALDNLWDYLKWMALPVPDERASWISDARPYFAVGLLVAGTAGGAWRPRTLGFAFLWMLVALLPYLFFLTGSFERYTYLPAVPLAMFVAFALSEVYLALRARLTSLMAGVAVGALVVVLAVFLGIEARDQQPRISQIASSYEQLFVGVPAACGDLPPESTLVIVDTPVNDIFGTRIRMAMNLRYDDVTVELRGSDPPPSASDGDCVVRFDRPSRRYVRVG